MDIERIAAFAMDGDGGKVGGNPAGVVVGPLPDADEMLRAAAEVGVVERLHLWPDRALGARKVVARQLDPESYVSWLQRWWSRVSEWPRQPGSPEC